MLLSSLQRDPMKKKKKNTVHITLKVNAFIIRLALWAGKMKQILCSDWLPEWTRWAYFACSGMPTLFPQKCNLLAI